MKKVLLLLVMIFSVGLASASEINEKTIADLELSAQIASATLEADFNASNYVPSGFCQIEDAYAVTTYMYQSDGTATRTVVRKSDNKIINHTNISYGMATMICNVIAPPSN